MVYFPKDILKHLVKADKVCIYIFLPQIEIIE